MKIHPYLSSSREDLNDLSCVQRKKRIQKMKILKNLCFDDPKQVSEICNDCKISHPTFTALAGQLIVEGLVKKAGLDKSVGGRRPDLYSLQAESFYLLSIHIEKFKIRMAIVDNNNNILRT